MLNSAPKERPSKATLPAKNIRFESEGIEINGVLREIQGPKSSAVIFCHGAFEFQENWFPYAEQLNEEGYPTFTFDFAGHGQSQGLRSKVDLRLWAYNIRDAMNCLQSQGYTRYALVGWGSGGSASILAAAHDTRLSCAVILSAPVYLYPSLADRVAYGLVSTAATIKKALFKRPLTLSRLNELSKMQIMADESANQHYLTNPKLQEIYKAIPIPDSLDSVWVDITRGVAKVTLPTLILHGTEDEIIPIEQSQKLYDLLQGPKKLKMIEGSGHALHLDRGKDTVYRMISNWLKRYAKN